MDFCKEQKQVYFVRKYIFEKKNKATHCMFKCFEKRKTDFRIIFTKILTKTTFPY